MQTSLARRSAPVLIALCLAAGCSTEERVIGIGDVIHHDDFEYSVRDVATAPDINGRSAAGVFYIVTFQVENRAKRVNHIWTNDIAYLVDERGRTYENAAASQHALLQSRSKEQPERHVTEAGAIERTIFVFDLPNDVHEAYLKVRGETLMGDVFNGNQFRRMRVRVF